jgi:hypothetical protein
MWVQPHVQALLREDPATYCDLYLDLIDAFLDADWYSSHSSLRLSSPTRVQP